jgi:hypothetical protein
VGLCLGLAGPAWAQNVYRTPVNTLTAPRQPSSFGSFGSFGMSRFLPSFLSGGSTPAVGPTATGIPVPADYASGTAYLRAFGLRRPVRAAIPQ